MHYVFRTSIIRILIAVLACPLAVISAQSGEPTCNGKSLSEWLLDLHGEASSGKVAEEAVRQIGTNALPTLLDMAGATDRNAKGVLAKLQNKQLQEVYKSKEANVEDLRNLAVDGFAILGTNATPAIPQLTKLIRGPETRLQAMRALTKVGPGGFSVLTNALADKDDEFRNNLVWVIGEEGGGDPKVITAILIHSLKDRDPTIRGNAADFLAGKDPNLAIPALISVLDDREYYPRARAAIALGSFGPAAKSASPKLLSVYTNVVAGQDKQLARDLGSALRDALKQIDPAVAAKIEPEK
jgi:HEAT repeat protein